MQAELGATFVATTQPTSTASSADPRPHVAERQPSPIRHRRAGAGGRPHVRRAWSTVTPAKCRPCLLFRFGHICVARAGSQRPDNTDASGESRDAASAFSEHAAAGHGHVALHVAPKTLNIGGPLHDDVLVVPFRRRPIELDAFGRLLSRRSRKLAAPIFGHCCVRGGV